MSADIPFITVVMPVRNEAKFIADTLGQLREQDYPKDRFEILVADGMSDDGTRDIVTRIADEDERVRLLDNPKRRSSSGRNVGFRAGQGDLFVVVDGHCHIPDDQFLRNIAECFEKSGADCLGRPQPLDPPGLTPFQKSVSLARASRLGHGGDSLIYGDFEGFASPVSNGAAYRREVFEKVGYVDEDFDACEDVEFNYRVEQAGFKAYTSPKLTVRYYPRENLSALIGQMRRYGRGRTRLYRKHPALLSLSALIPACFAGGVAAFVALLGLDFMFGLSAFLAFVFSALALALLAYAALVGMTTVRICREHGWDHVWRVPFVFLAVHGGLGLGMWEGLYSPFVLNFFRGRGETFSTENDRYISRAERFMLNLSVKLKFILKRILSLTKDCKNREPLKFLKKRKSSSPIRIAFIIDSILSPTGGSERQLLLLLENLDRNNFDPRLCVLQNSPWLQANFLLCPVYVLNIKSFKSPKSWLNMIRFAVWLKKEKIDVLQTHFRDASIIGIIAGWLARVSQIIATRKNQGYWMQSNDLFMFQNFLNRVPNIFVANSEATRQWAKKTECIDGDRIRVIHNGLSSSEVYPFSVTARIKARELMGIRTESFIVGIVANLRPVKRIDVFLQSAKLVKNEISNAKFIVIGEGEERSRLEAMADNLGLRDDVLFMGSRFDVSDILRGFDVGVLSSDSESFSNSVVEYMAAGLPIVATDVGGCREAFGDSPAGFIIETGDSLAMAKSIVHISKTKSLIQQAREIHPLRVQNMFSKKNYIKNYESLYTELISNRS
jgi:glycosyltransferase involved in cell wall biosynthesis